MKPLSKLFRSEPSSPLTLEAQLAALEAGPADVIIAAALGDGNEVLRTAAVRKLPDGEVLRRLAGFDAGASAVPVVEGATASNTAASNTAASPPAASSPLERVAQERVAQLVDAGTIKFAELSPVGNTAAVLSVAGMCRDPAYLAEALASISNLQRIATLVIEGSSSRIRQLAAQRIEDPAELTRLLKLARDKDKSVYKILKQKYDALRAEEERIAQIESDVNSSCASLEHIGQRVYDANYTASFEYYQAQWRKVEALAAPGIQERARAAIDRCRAVIDAHLQELAEQAAEVSRHAAQLQAREASRAAAIVQAAEEAQQQSEAEALAAAEAARIREEEDKARAERLAAEAAAVRRIGGLIGQVNSAIREGNTGRAAGLRRAIEEKLPTAPVVPAYIEKQVHQLDAKLNDLKEWKDFAVAPKRAELIAEMEGLIGSTEAPQALADRIKQLQEQWKTISKGIVSDSEADWQRFHQAAQTAYQPCRDYFEAQAKLRQENVEKRKVVVARLQAFETAQSAEHADWRAVAAVLREAPREFRQHSPVERAAGRAVQEEFDAAMGRLQGRIDEWYAQNVAEKKSLIERAQQLLSKEDGREATDGVKRLQALWKDVGSAPRDQEQALWNEFRAQCDGVFQKRQQAYSDYAAGLEAHKGQAVALCEEVEQAATLSGPALLEATAKHAQWRASFESLGEIPRTDERGLRERFERAIKLCQTRVSQLRAHDKEQSFGHMLEAARQIRVYGWMVAHGGESADRDALKHAAESFIAGVQQWPKGGAQALKDAWLKAESATVADLPDHEKALRMLCIRSEILTDKPTPTEDQPLRREYQVQRLMKHMGQGSSAPPDELDALALEWVRVGPVAAATQESLLVRFLSCR
ncbi:MAG: DUF349 domain-containing protein [Gammaproteobacteria bacterium]